MLGWPSRTADRVARRTPPTASRPMSNVSRWTAVSGSKKPSPRLRTSSTYDPRWTEGGPASPRGEATGHGRGTADRTRSRTMGSVESISRHRPAQVGPHGRDGSMDDTDGQRSLRIGSESGPRVGNPPDSAGGSSPAPAPRFDGSSAMREMVLGPADYPLPRPELARDLTGGGTMVP